MRFGHGHECSKCKRKTKWYRLKNEQAYSCPNCGNHLHPQVGTIFEKSRTPLQLWFYAIFLFTSTRHGVSAKELQRQLGVTYKCAHRMATKIREHMAAVDGEDMLGGEGEVVQIDETYVGGKAKGKRGRGAANKTAVLGMVEPDGKVMALVVPNTSGKTLQPIIEANIAKGSELQTDEWGAYRGIAKKGYTHKTVNHGAKQYVAEDGTTTNAIENFWRHVKCSIKGTHISVSSKHLQSYVKEFEYRFNRRMRPETMLGELLSRFPELDA